MFEYVGGLIVPDDKRKPLNIVHLRFGRLGWFVLHIALIGTVFLAGFYVGRVTLTK